MRLLSSGQSSKHLSLASQRAPIPQGNGLPHSALSGAGRHPVERRPLEKKGAALSSPLVAEPERGEVFTRLSSGRRTQGPQPRGHSSRVNTSPLSATKGLLTSPLLLLLFYSLFHRVASSLRESEAEGGHSLVEWAPAAARGRGVYSTGATTSGRFVRPSKIRRHAATPPLVRETHPRGDSIERQQRATSSNTQIQQQPTHIYTPFRN